MPNDSQMVEVENPFNELTPQFRNIARQLSFLAFGLPIETRVQWLAVWATESAPAWRKINPQTDPGLIDALLEMTIAAANQLLIDHQNLPAPLGMKMN